MIENQPNEITLIFHSDKDKDKKMRAFVETISTFKTKTLDLKREALTQTQLAEIANKMKVEVKALIDELYMDTLKGLTKEGEESMSENDMLTLISKNLLLLNTPIIIIGKDAYHYKLAYQILEEKFNITGVASNFSPSGEEKQ
jgi:arsenate reductase-like glutaredoxin family protein